MSGPGARARAVAASLLLFLGCPGERPPTPARARRAGPPGNGYNVLLLTIDTLRADHLGAYGYRRPTSPHIDGLAARGTLFERAYTYWPKTRGSMTIVLSGRRPSQNGYSKTHPSLLGFNPTLASTLQEAGYRTAAAVDNANVAAAFGYAKGFDSYRETWTEKALKTEPERARAITETALALLGQPRAETPWLLWLHYVSPHAPYKPPAPFDTAFVDAEAAKGPSLPIVPGFHDGIHKEWALAGHDRLGYYVAQYDGEIAAADAEVGRVLDGLRASGQAERTVVVLASDHGESLGEHGYYFDHGEDVFEPCLAVPLIVVAPGGKPGVRSLILASTLDIVPTILDALKVSYPPDLGGASLMAALAGTGGGPDRGRLFAQNDRNLRAGWDGRYRIVATPEGDGERYALFDRQGDPGETRDVAKAVPDAFRRERAELERYRETTDREWSVTRRSVEGAPAQGQPAPETCEQLKALGYAPTGCPQ